MFYEMSDRNCFKASLSRVPSDVGVGIPSVGETLEHFLK